MFSDPQTTHYQIFQNPTFALWVFFVSTSWTRPCLVKGLKCRSFNWATISFIKFPAVAIQVAFAFLQMVRAYNQKLVTESINQKVRNIFPTRYIYRSSTLEKRG